MEESITVYIDIDDAFDEETVKELRALWSMEETLAELQSATLRPLLHEVRQAKDLILEWALEDNEEVDMDCYTQICHKLDLSEEVFPIEDFLDSKEKYMAWCDLIFV